MKITKKLGSSHHDSLAVINIYECHIYEPIIIENNAVANYCEKICAYLPTYLRKVSELTNFLFLFVELVRSI